MRLVLPTDLLRLLPEVGELLGQGARGAQVQHILPGQRVVQERVTHVGEEPAERAASLLENNWGEWGGGSDTLLVGRAFPLC